MSTSFAAETGVISSLDSPSHRSLIALSSGGKFAHLRKAQQFTAVGHRRKRKEAEQYKP